MVPKYRTYVLSHQVALVVKNPPANAGDTRDTGSVPGSGQSPGGGNGNPLQYSYLENLIDRGPGRLQSMGSKRVEHNEHVYTHTHTCMRAHTHTCTHASAPKGNIGRNKSTIKTILNI